MMVEINLLPTRQRRNLFSLLLVVGVVLVLVLSILFYVLHYQGVKKSIVQLENSIATTESLRMIQEQQLLDSAGESTLDVLESQIEWIQQQKISVESLLSFFVGKLPERGYFLNYTYVEQGNVEIAVQFDTPAEVSAYLYELNSSSFIQEASLLTITTEELDEQEGSEDEWLPRYVANFQVSLDVNEVKLGEGNHHD